jgi:4-carboxymuconolactone decarboxylase
MYGLWVNSRFKKDISNGGLKMNLYDSDPEFMERFEHFAFEEVVGEEGQQLDDITRYMAILATLIGCQGMDEYKIILSKALDSGLIPVMAKEIVYQSVDYLGIGRTLPFLTATNEILLERGVKLPLEGQATTTLDNRLEKGIKAQMDIFGEGMKDFWKGGHINRWLAANCFGDYYTRTGLDLAQREMITFCFLAAQGGCEPQLASHAAGNMRLGNDKKFLIKVVSQCLPYIGYPRSLNAIACVNKAAEANL